MTRPESAYSIGDSHDQESPARAADPSGERSLDDLGCRIVALAGRLAAATCRWLLLVAEFDARDGCQRFGLGCTSSWLAHACGISRRTAVDHVRVARALAQHPQLAAEMSAGRLSYSHVRAIARVARPDEQRLVSDLVTVAQHGTVGQLESMVRGLRTVEHNDPPETPPDYLAHSWGADGRWRMQARLDPESGAVVEAALKAVASKENLSAAQALVRMAEIAQAALNDNGTPPRQLRGDEQAAVVIHLDAAAVPQPDGQHGSPEPVSVPAAPRRPYARIADGPGLPDHVVQRLACSGRVRTVLWAPSDDRSDVLDLGRSHRVVSDRQFRALLLRDGGCTHPGCPTKRGLQAHHVRHWLHGGPTNLGNLLLLCQRHHRAHHLGQFTITGSGSGQFQFLRPDRRVLPDVVNPAALIDTATPLEDEHPDVTPDAAASHCAGDRLDRAYAIACLATNRSSAA